jgi:hypothetical protein
MELSESLQKWKEFGLNQKTDICELEYTDLIVHTGNNTTGMVATYRDITEGKTSKTEGPIQVCWLKEENKFLVTDGFHRFLEGLLEGKTTYLCEVDWTGYTLRWSVPPIEERFVLENRLK